MGEREKSEKQQTTIHTRENHTNRKFLNVEQKNFTKILCGCTNPIVKMAPTDHCRTQNEHRIGRNSESKLGEKNRKKENEINMKKPEVYREPMHMKIIQIHTPYHNWRDWIHKVRQRRDPYF